MLSQQPRSARLGTVLAVLITAIFSIMPSAATAQEQEHGSFLGTIAKQLILDPTTYGPSLIAYDATLRDWNTSQPFFQHGFVEHNSRFTISGRPNDIPVPYAEGRRRIVADAMTNLGMSTLNNFTGRVFERMLIERYPQHRKVVRTVSWVERISFGVYMSYVLSRDHYRQAELNGARAQQLGYR